MLMVNICACVHFVLVIPSALLHVHSWRLVSGSEFLVILWQYHLNFCKLGEALKWKHWSCPPPELEPTA